MILWYGNNCRHKNLQYRPQVSWKYRKGKYLWLMKQFIFYKIRETRSHHCRIRLCLKSKYFQAKIRTIQVTMIPWWVQVSSWKLWHQAVTIGKFVHWKIRGYFDYNTKAYLTAKEGFTIQALASTIFQFITHKISETLIHHCRVRFC